jgi:poly-gamma-glutamate synthesis protein (capsule biosynthesis protein)
VTDAVARAWLAVTGDVAPMREVREHDERLRALLHDAEVAFGNLEAPLTARGLRAEKAATHRAHPDRVRDVIAFGFDVVTLANNHMLDFGTDGLADTLATLAKAGVAAVGAGMDRASALRAAIRPSSRGAVGFIGLCAALPPGFAATDERAGVAPLRVTQSVAIDPAIQQEQPGGAPFMHTTAHAADVEAACEAVRAARRDARFVVVALHWGIPHGFAARSYGILAEYQRPVAHALVDAGADLVVGHHPHVVHPIERYKGALIAYSLGNYVFHSWGHFNRPAPADMPADAASEEVEETLVLDMPFAPYRNAFGAEEMLESIVVLADPVGGGIRYRFVPTVMRAGDPFIADDERAHAVLRRLTHPALPPVDGGYTPRISLVRDPRVGAVGEVTIPEVAK